MHNRKLVKFNASVYVERHCNINIIEPTRGTETWMTGDFRRRVTSFCLLNGSCCCYSDICIIGSRQFELIRLLLALNYTFECFPKRFTWLFWGKRYFNRIYDLPHNALKNFHLFSRILLLIEAEFNWLAWVLLVIIKVKNNGLATIQIRINCWIFYASPWFVYSLVNEFPWNF